MKEREATSQEREQGRLQRLAREYRARGYRVIMRPQGADIPDFLRGFEPDLIARKGGRGVVVEVKTKESLRKTPDISALARAVKLHRGWKFELVLTNPRDAIDPATRLLEDAEIEDLLQTAETLKHQGRWAPACLVAWAAAEATIRLMLVREEGVNAPTLPLAALKTAYSLGLVAYQDYLILERCFAARNRIAHGFKSDDITPTDVADLVDLTRRLNAEVRSSGSEGSDEGTRTMRGDEDRSS